MSKKNQTVKSMLPALGIVFGTGAGILISVLYVFPLWGGVAGGAAAGLLIGMIASNLFGKRNGTKDGD